MLGRRFVLQLLGDKKSLEVFELDNDMIQLEL